MTECLEIAGLTIAATWQDVLYVGGMDKKADLEKFTLDKLAEVIIEDQIDNFTYELVLDGTTVPYVKPAGESNPDIALNYITALKATRALFYKFDFAVNSDFNDTIDVFLERELVPLPISGTGVTLRESDDPDEPLKYGGRARILLDVANRVRLNVYQEFLTEAQKLLAAHFAFQSLLPPEGRGTISSEVFEGESTSWLIPKLNPKADQEDLMTLVGTRFYRIRKSRIVPYRQY